MKALANVLLTIALLVNAAVVVAVLTSCGGDSAGGGYGSDPSPPPPPPPSPDDAAFAAIKPLVDSNCVKCHDGVKQKPALTSAAAFKASKAKARLEAGTMPPAPNVLAPDVKQKLLAYLGG